MELQEQWTESYYFLTAEVVIISRYITNFLKLEIYFIYESSVKFSIIIAEVLQYSQRIIESWSLLLVGGDP